jgi:hypothetical protein
VNHMMSTASTASQLRSTCDLTTGQVDQMHALLSRYFDGVTRAQFEADLGEKNWAILIERAGRLVGFTTMLSYETTFQGEPISVIYSGDTIVAPDAWNSSALPRTWIESVAKLRRAYPRGEYIWLLITSGFRTYRVLPLFWRRFHPRFNDQQSAASVRLLEHLARERFGDQFDADRGIVRLRHPQRLHGELAAVPDSRVRDPHVAFFLSKNPGHARGDELVCVTELAPQNLTPAGRRMASGVPQW